MRIFTDNKPRPLFTLADLSAEEQARFDYIKEAEAYDPRFFNYKDYWYDAHEFTRVPDSLKPWDGVHGDSYFSGILVRFCGRTDNPSVICGTYFA